MTQPYNGMRKGISLVEMIIAVILFATLASITIKYYKNFFNTELTAKKARIGALLDQGAQMSNAYDAFVAQVGSASFLDVNLSQLTDGNISILTRLPQAIQGLATGEGRFGAWELNNTSGISGTTGYALQYKLDMNGTGNMNNGSLDDEQYCVLINHESNASLDFNVSATSAGLAAYIPTDIDNAYHRYGQIFCYRPTAAVTPRLIIVKP